MKLLNAIAQFICDCTVILIAVLLVSLVVWVAGCILGFCAHFLY